MLKSAKTVAIAAAFAAALTFTGCDDPSSQANQNLVYGPPTDFNDSTTSSISDDAHPDNSEPELDSVIDTDSSSENPLAIDEKQQCVYGPPEDYAESLGLEDHTEVYGPPADYKN